MGEDKRNTGLREKHLRQFKKTALCRFFLKNECIKGADCAFSHGLAEIRERPDLNYTSLCRTFLQTGKCDDPDCTYAHNKRQLRATPGFLKTKLCFFADEGSCKHGSACRFAQTIEELAQHNPELALQMGANKRSGNAGTMMLTDGTGGSPPGPRGGDANAMRANAGRGDWAGTASDHSGSTRAESSASAATPAGNADSGQEEPADGIRGQQQRNGTVGERGQWQGAPGRSAPAQGGDGQEAGRRTTLMITNVPNTLTQGSLVSILEDLTVCMRGRFDFFYCPWDPNRNRNLGHAIVNFCSKSAAAQFERQWQDQLLLPPMLGQRRLRIVPAKLQGVAANLRHYSGVGFARHADPRFRPLVRAAPNEALQPTAISEEFGQSPGAQNRDGQGTLAQACARTQAIARMAASAMLAAVRLPKMATATSIAAIGMCARRLKTTIPA